MKRTPTRRNFLKSGLVGTLGGAALVGSANSVAAAETVVLSGTVTAENGATIRNDEMNASGSGTFENTRTDADGYFEIDVPNNGEYKIGYYKADSQSDLEGTKDGVPHIYNFGRKFVSGEDKDLGELTLPEADIVDLRVLKPNGEPLMGSQPGYRYSGWGANPGRLALNTDGYAVIEGASFTGLELVGHATAEVDSPVGDEYEDRTYKRQVSVDGPTEIVATIDSSGATWEVNRGETETTETTETTTQTPASTSTTTETRATEADPTRTATPAGTTTSGTTTTSSEANETTAKTRRGFFSNGADAGDLDMLNDPFYLTVGGFVLSAGGIAYQMLEGY